MERIKMFFVAIKVVLLSTRMKSLYWRGSMMVVAGFCNVLADSLVGFHLTPEATTLFGLVLGEISKSIHNQMKTE